MRGLKVGDRIVETWGNFGGKYMRTHTISKINKTSYTLGNEVGKKISVKFHHIKEKISFGRDSTFSIGTEENFLDARTEVREKRIKDIKESVNRELKGKPRDMVEIVLKEILEDMKS